jgi:ubiquinone/menaquinone biosynthesis C-methylase UbiE
MEDDKTLLPNPELVRSLYTRGLKTQVLRMALLLDIFSPLAYGPVSAEFVAKKCDCSINGIKYLLNSLYTFDLLEVKNNLYQLSPTAEIFLVPGKPSYVGDWVLEQTNPAIFQDVLQSIQSGQPFSRAVPWHQLAWLESYDDSRITVSLNLWKAAGVQPESHSSLRILDLACGSSIVSFALARQYSHIHVTCVDHQEVLQVARDLAERFNIENQVHYVAGDLHSLEFGEQTYDIVLLGNVTNFFTEQQNIALFKNIYRCLKTRGLLVLDVTMKGDSKERNEHLGLYSLILWTFSGTEYYSFEDYQNWLAALGFSQVNRLSKHWLSARK